MNIAIIAILIALAAPAATAQTLTATSVPADWTSTVIGAPGTRGSAVSTDGTFTLESTGTDIWDTADQFTFVHRQLTGDGVIVVRVASLQHVHRWSKAGVMIRESLAPQAKHAYALVSGSVGVAFQRRRTTGGSSVHTDGGAGAAPVWLKLERRGSTFTMSRSPDGVTWSVVGHDAIAMGSTVYVGLAVTSHTLAATATARFTHVSSGMVPEGATLPAGWMSGDVGAPAIAGSAWHDGTAYVVRGAGADIWNRSDQFRFVHTPVSGDVDVVVRVTGLERTDPWAKAGVMLRASLTGGSAHASLFVSPERGVAFQRRPTKGAESVHTSGGSGHAPVWLKLERRGSTITAYRSSNGTTWTRIGSQVMSLPSSFFVGVAVTSHNAAAAATARFEQLAVTPAGPMVGGSVNQPPMVALMSPQGGATFAAPATIPLAASASDADGSVTRVDFYHGSTLIGSRTSSPYSITWHNVSRGAYSVVAVARDNAGATTVSGQRVIEVRENDPPGTAVFVPSSNHDAAVTNYVLEIFPSSADPRVAQPVVTQDLGKPPVVNGECAADVSYVIAVLPPGTYIAVVTAVGTGGSVRSAPSAPFVR